MKKMNVGVYPAKVPNEYINRLRDILLMEHRVYKVPHVRWLQLNRLRVAPDKLDVLFVSWLDDTLVVRSSGRLRMLGPLLYRLKLAALRRISHRLVMVRHNIYPHHTAPQDRAVVEQLIDRFEASFDAVITHSGHQVNDRYYVPHPLYRLADPVGDLAESLESDFFLAFGFIKPYKNLLELVKHWTADRLLIIAGPASDQHYVDQLKLAAKGRHVDIRPGFLAEAEASSLMSKASGAILAHDGKDMVVSGSYFYAISHGTPVYALASDFLTWLESRNGPGVNTYDSLGKLCDQVRLQTPPDEASRRALKQDAEFHFGDQQVLSSLNEVMSCLTRE